MAYGDGSITEIKRPDGGSYSPKRWKVRIYKGVDPVTKKQVFATETVHGTKAEARRVRDELRAAPLREIVASREARKTFKEFSQRWHERRVATDAISSNRQQVESYILDAINGFLGQVAVGDITPQLVEDCLFAIRDSKVEGGGRCSGTTLRMHYALLRQILDKAVDLELISRNPANKVEPPKCDTQEIRPLNQTDSRRLTSLLNRCEAESYEKRRAIEARRLSRQDDSQPRFLRGLSEVSRYLAIRLALLAGVRRGEALALRWGEVDLGRSKIHVVASLNPKGELKGPKTKASRRYISLDGPTTAHLRYWKEEQRRELSLLSTIQTDLTPVCCSDLGGFICPNNLERWWRDFRDENGFEDVTIHALRHTHATQLIANGMDIKTVQHRLGHSSAAITMNLYAHFVPERDEDAAQLIGSLLNVPDGERFLDEGFQCAS